MKKVYIATSRKIGEKCRQWATANLPPGYEIVEDSSQSDIFISVLYDKILTPFFINSRKCFNFHPGILPQYRGAGAYSWVLINGDDKTGITLHLMDDGIDSGDKTMFKMFADWFHNILEGDYEAIKQDESFAALYYRKDLSAIKDLSKYIRGLTFKDKESAYYVDNQGNKKYIHFEDNN